MARHAGQPPHRPAAGAGSRCQTAALHRRTGRAARDGHQPGHRPCRRDPGRRARPPAASRPAPDGPRRGRWSFVTRRHRPPRRSGPGPVDGALGHGVTFGATVDGYFLAKAAIEFGLTPVHSLFSRATFGTTLPLTVRVGSITKVAASAARLSKCLTSDTMPELVKLLSTAIMLVIALSPG